MEGGSYQKRIFVNTSIECIWGMKELTLTVPQVPWFLKTVKFFLVVASIPGRKSSGMSSERSWNFKSPFGSSLAVISRKALDGLIIVPSSPVSIPTTKLMSAQETTAHKFHSSTYLSLAIGTGNAFYAVERRWVVHLWDAELIQSLLLKY